MFRLSKVTAKYLIILLLLVGGISCTTQEKSPDPGVLRIKLQSAIDDTTIVMANDTLAVNNNNELLVQVFQGKVFKNDKYFILYKNLHTTIQQDQTFNLLQFQNNIYKKFKIFDTHVPPGTYNRIEFGLTPDAFQIAFRPPTVLKLVPEDDRLVNMETNFRVFEHDTTELLIRLRPLDSIIRKRNTLLFDRKLEVSDVVHY